MSVKKWNKTVSGRVEKINLLDTVPVRRESIRTEWSGECAVLAYPRFKRPWMQRFLLPKGMSPYIRVTLEEHGTAVWQLIDGKRTVGEIIDLLAEHFAHEAGYESRVTTYFMQLQKDGFILLYPPSAGRP
ncbi:MAG: PqqD family protein [Bacteroides sp.]|nr:PqqD family protein [Bacteroides sp.]